MAITLEQAKRLTRNDTLYHVTHRNADGSPQRWRVNGMVKRWKRTPDRIQVPLKHGLYSYGYLTEDDLDLVCLVESEALANE
jgi:hypothetical protein